MATQVFRAAGAALGGPVGANVGSIIGREIDRSLRLQPQARLSDLRLPSTQYGDAIPAVHGRMRVGGLVLWSGTPLATATIGKNGSGQGSTVSFAFAITSGRVENVERIWADGRLIRDGEGRQAVGFTMRVHRGDEDQLSDPLIASLLGEERAPAFRGIAYLLFEDFDLSSFGNRLPLITAEVEGAGSSIIAEEIIAERIGIGSPAFGGHPVLGFAAVGDDQASAIAPLLGAYNPRLAYRPGGWTLKPEPVDHLIGEELWQLEEDRPISGSPGEGFDMPTRVSVRYFDPEIDFAASEKSARVSGTERLKRVELPAALAGADAKAAAREHLSYLQERARQIWLRLPLSFAKVRLGDRVMRAAAPERVYHVTEIVLAGGDIKVRLSKPMTSAPAALADAGGVIGARVLMRSPLQVSVVELPGASFETEPVIAIGVSGGFVPFEPLTASVRIGEFEQDVQSQGTPSPPARLLSPLPPASAELIDRQHSIHLRFEGDDPFLTSRTEAALLHDVNLLYVDGEFIQFAQAEPLGDACYRLSNLLRGRFDSTTGSTHPSGTRVVVLDPERCAIVRVPRQCIGLTASIRVHGPDGAIASDEAVVSGRAVRPWAPCNVTVVESDGGLQVSWTRRCKEGLHWLDQVDAPLGSSQERYLVRLSSELSRQVIVETMTPSVTIDGQMLRQLGPRPWQIEIKQMGDFAAGNSSLHVIR